MDEYIAFVQSHPLHFAGLAVVIFFIVKTEIARLTRKYKQVNTNEAVQLLNNDDTILLDVREDKEVAEGYIKGAKHIPLSNLSSHISELGGKKDKPVLVYCRSGNRSGSACSQLTGEGFTDVSNLAGGILGWESANLPISKR